MALGPPPKIAIKQGVFQVEVPASTSNLGPGVGCLGLALDLALKFEAEVGVSSTTVERPRDPFGEVVPLERDFLVRGFRSALEGWGIDPPEVAFRVREQPPIARGLGTSAAAIVGGAALAEALLWAPVGRREVARVAFSIERTTQNVCAAALGGLVITASTSGRRLLVRGLTIHPMWRVAVAVPSVVISPEDAHNALRETVPVSAAIANMGRAMLLVHALLLGDVGPFPEFTEDFLHEPFCSPLIPGWEAVRKAALDAGAAGVFIGGGGSSVAALVPGDARVVADRMVEAFAAAGVEAVPLALDVGQCGYQVHRV